MTTNLIKTSDNSVEIQGVGVGIGTFITRMGKLGYDTDITEQTLFLLTTGGKWVLNFTKPELKYLTQPAKPNKGGGKGF